MNKVVVVSRRDIAAAKLLQTRDARTGNTTPLAVGKIANALPRTTGQPAGPPRGTLN